MEFPKLTIMKEKSKDSINPKMFNEGNKSSHDFKQWIDIFYIQKIDPEQNSRKDS